MPTLSNTIGYSINDKDLKDLHNRVDPDGLPNTTEKFEITDPNEQAEAIELLKPGLEMTARRIADTASDLYNERRVGVVDYKGNSVTDFGGYDLLEVLTLDDFVYADTTTTPPTPRIKSNEAATRVKELYGQHNGETILKKVSTFVDSIQDVGSIPHMSRFISNWNSINQTDPEIGKEMLKEALILTLASLEPSSASKLLNDLQSGKLTLFKERTITPLYQGVSTSKKELTDYSVVFIKSFGYIARREATNNKALQFSTNMKNALAFDFDESSTRELLLNGQPTNEITFGQNLDVAAWTADGEHLYKGLSLAIENLVSDQLLKVILKKSDKVNVETGGIVTSGVTKEELRKVAETLEGLKIVKTRVSASDTTAIKEATETLGEQDVRTKLSIYDKDILSIVVGNLSIKDARREQVLVEKAFEELNAVVNKYDVLPWDSSKTWDSYLTKLDGLIGPSATTVDLMTTLSELEKAALFGNPSVKAVAEKYLFQMITQQILVLPQADGLIDDLNGKPLTQYGEIMYKFLTDATKLDGNRSLEMVKAAELWLSVLKNYKSFEEIITKNSAGDPTVKLQYENLMNFVAIDSNNIVNYNQEGALETVEGLQASEIAKVLGVPEDDPIVKKILESRDQTKALSNETSRMSDIFNKLKGKAFALATAGALSAVSLAVGGGALLAVAGVGLAVFNVVRGVKQAGGFKNFIKAFGTSVKNSFATLSKALNPNSDMTKAERAWAIGTTLFGTTARLLIPGAGALVAGAAEVGVAIGFESSLSKKQLELKKAMDTVLTDLSASTPVNITLASGAVVPVKMLPYIKLYTRKLDELKKVHGNSYDADKAIADMVTMGGEYEKAALVYAKVKERLDAVHLMEKYDAVSRTVNNYNAMLAGSIASNIISMGARVTNAVMDRIDLLRENTINPALEKANEGFDRFGSRVNSAWHAAKEDWHSTSNTHQTNADNLNADALAEKANIGNINLNTTGSLSVPGSPWHGTTLGLMEGGMETNPSHYFGGSDGMAATIFHTQATEIGGSNYIDTIFGGDTDTATRVLNQLKAQYNGYYGARPDSLDYDLYDAYKDVTGNSL